MELRRSDPAFDAVYRRLYVEDVNDGYTRQYANQRAVAKVLKEFGVVLLPEGSGPSYLVPCEMTRAVGASGGSGECLGICLERCRGLCPNLAAEVPLVFGGSTEPVSIGATELMISVLKELLSEEVKELLPVESTEKLASKIRAVCGDASQAAIAGALMINLRGAVSGGDHRLAAEIVHGLKGLLASWGTAMDEA